MIDTTTDIESALETDIPLHPSGILMALITALLAPMFLGVSAGDIALARIAATETVAAYRARNHADLLAVAQIIAFGLAALGSLSLSLADDISLPMALRLRGNANACNRSAEQSRRTLAKSLANDHAPTAPEPDTPPALPETEATPEPEPDRLLSLAAERELAAEAQARLRTTQENAGPTPVQPLVPTQSTAPTTAEKRHREMWAIAMVKEASEITAGIANLPPAERGAASTRAAVLSSTAHDLLYGAPVPPLISSALARITWPDIDAPQLLPKRTKPKQPPRRTPARPR